MTARRSHGGWDAEARRRGWPSPRRSTSPAPRPDDRLMSIDAGGLQVLRPATAASSRRTTRSTRSSADRRRPTRLAWLVLERDEIADLRWRRSSSGERRGRPGSARRSSRCRQPTAARRASRSIPICLSPADVRCKTSRRRPPEPRRRGREPSRAARHGGRDRSSCRVVVRARRGVGRRVPDAGGHGLLRRVAAATSSRAAAWSPTRCGATRRRRSSFPRPAFEVWLPLPTFLAGRADGAPRGDVRGGPGRCRSSSAPLVPVLAWRLAADVAVERAPADRAGADARGRDGPDRAVYLPLILHSTLPDSTMLFAALALAARVC